MTCRGSSAEICGDEVGAPRLDHLVDDGVGGAVDALLEVAHHAGREALVDQAPVAGVEGRVHVEHHQALLGDLVRPHLEGHGALGGGAEALVVPVDGDAVLVAGDGPESRARRARPASARGRGGAGRPDRRGGHRPRRTGSRRGRPGRRPPGCSWLTAPLKNRTACPIVTDGKSRWLRCQRSFGRHADLGEAKADVRPWAPDVAGWSGAGLADGGSAGVAGTTAIDFVGSSGSRITRSRVSASGGSPGTSATMAISCGGGAKTDCRPRAMPVPMPPMADSLRQRSKPWRARPPRCRLRRRCSGACRHHPMPSDPSSQGSAHWHARHNSTVMTDVEVTTMTGTGVGGS